MLPSRRVVIVVIAIVFLMAAGAYANANPVILQGVLGRVAPSEPDGSDLVASGFVEAEEVSISSELGGRVVELLVDEGDEVEAGQVLVQLDGTRLNAQIDVARASLDVSEAQLAQVRAGPTAEQIRRAETTVLEAEAARDGACQALDDAIAIRDSSQELDAQIVLARAQVAAAEAGLNRAVALKDLAEIANDSYRKGMHALGEAQGAIEEIPEALRPSLPGLQLSTHLIPNVYWKSWVGVNTAQAALDGAGAALSSLYSIRDTPQELDSQVDAAETQCQSIAAAVQIAEAQLNGLRAGATDEDVAVMASQVEQAQAALQSLEVIRDKLTLIAPVGGMVLERIVQEGELAAPGAALLTLGELDVVDMTVYVPENRLGQTFIGQQVMVRVDSFSQRTFEGTVVSIAHEAEFTPRNVQTQEERVNMVFAVEVRIPNPDHALKPGLPADASIVTEEQGRSE